MLEDPKLWVAVAFVGFVALAWKPLGRFLAKALDERGDAIRKELDEAKRLREEASAVLASYQQRQQDVLKEAEALLAHARDEAARLSREAEADLKKNVEARRTQAMERIAQAETQAIREVQNHIIDLAVNAARTVIQQQLDKGAADALITLAVADIEKKIH